MRWDYTSDIRDEFGKGVHRDILIVPHATEVEKVPGSEPIITSKMPEWEWIGDEPNKKPIPAKDSHGNYIYKPVEWVITNKDIVKEKFKYSNSLNSDNNLTFSSCNAAQIQFTIRNEKEYNEEKGYWEPVIPNLQKYEFVETDPNGTERKIVGELLGNACVEAYMYFNGDSSTLIYLGMFKIEEDKLVDDGYSRQITGYDFLMWLREMDIFNWYKHLFEGINKLQSDYEDMTNESGEEVKKPDDWDENWIRDPKKKWTIKEALTDLIEHLAAYDPVVYEPEIDPETKEKKIVMKVGNTITNPYEYGRDDYEEGNGYTGLGMPIMIDEDILKKGNERYIPSEPGEEEYERYGYMDILELEFYQDPKIMSAGALSAGKFLEDIGLLAGRYPIIRTDRFKDGYFVDPETIKPTPEEKHPSKYNNYERCILSFKPLPSVDEDDNIDKIPESKFDNSEIVKGFQHDYYQVQDILVMKFILDDNTEINYHKLNKAQYAAEQKSQIQTFTCTNNMFCSYLVTKSDNEDIKKMINKYKVIRNKLFGKDIAKGTVSPDALFNQGYNNIRNRIYTPCQLTTFADLVRDTGDRIRIDFTDKITGEESHFYTYILERELEGIQKMMDKYTAKGDMRSPVFTNYQASSKSGSNDQNNIELMTPFDLIEYMRNCGYRLLDEPMNCEAVFVKGTAGTLDLSQNHLYMTSSYPADSYIKDGDTTNPITVGGQQIDIIEGDYVQVKNYQHDDPVVHQDVNDPDNDFCWPLYVYINGSWTYVGTKEWQGYRDLFGKNIYDYSSYNAEHFLGQEDYYPTEEEILGQTENTIITKVIDIESYEVYIINYNPNYHTYGGGSWKYEEYGGTRITDPVISQAQFGDYAELAMSRYGTDHWHATARYQYPGFWVQESQYPKFEGTFDQGSKPYIQLKWTDPPDIDTWEPYPCNWEGTTIVRKEDSAPLHRWDGKKVVSVQTRDKYKTKGYKDEDIKIGKTYYYGFFPYYTADDSDPEHPIRYYTFTKTIKVETGNNSLSPVINSIDVNDNTATIDYTLVQPDSTTFKSIKLYGKIGENPNCDDTDNIVTTLSEKETTKDITGLTYDSTYYFCIVTTDNNDDELSSNVMDCVIGVS